MGTAIFRKIIFFLAFITFNTLTYAAGDDPCTATPLTVGTTCSYSNDDNNSATTSTGMADPGCASFTDNDIWFTVIVPSSGNLQIDTQTGTITDAGMAFYTGSTCTTLTLLSCDDDSSPNGLMPMLTASGLTPGSTIYVRFWKYGGGSGTFSVCATTFNPPPNDEPINSISVNAGTSCVTVSSTVLGASQSLPGCIGTANDDVWFSFTASQVNEMITVTPATGFDPVVEVFSGTVGSLVSIACNDASYPSGAIGAAIFNNLVVGQTYYYRVYQFTSNLPNSSNSNFTTCVSAPPPPPLNDEPCNAISLTVSSSCNNTSSSLYGATQSLNSTCGTVTPYDVWFSFVATQAYQNITVSNTSSSSMIVEIFSGNCNNLSSISCRTFNSGTATSVGGLTAGNTYYYRVYFNSSSTPTSNSTITTCVTSTLPPNTQDCLGAIPLCQNTYSTTTAYSGVGNINNEINSSISCLGSGEKNDVWYTFTVMSSGNLSFSITPNVLSNDYDWALYNLSNANCWDIATNSSLQVACNFSGSSGVTGANGQTGSQNNPVVPVTAGQTFVLNVSQYSTSNAGYSINFGASTALFIDNLPPSIATVVPSCINNTINVTFSENILCSAISPSDFTITGPDGPHTVTNITGIGCSLGGSMENTFTFSVNPPITVNGNYSLSLLTTAGSISDLCGNISPAQTKDFTILKPIMTNNVIQNVNCFGGNNGSASSSVLGGLTPYSYSWNLAGNTIQTTQDATNLSAGNYQVIVTDANGCKDTSEVVISEPSKISLTATILNISCGLDGTISTTANGGTSPYNYSWSPIINTTSTLNNISTVGNYSIHVTDNNGCIFDSTFSVVESTSFTNNINPINNQCLTGNQFNFSSNLSSSVNPNINYSWNFGDGTALSNLSSPSHSYTNFGIYQVTLITSTGICSDTSTIQIEVFENSTFTISSNTPCVGNPLNITSSATGMQSYSWSGPNSTLIGQNPTIQNTIASDAGIYTLTVIDINGCSTSSSITVNLLQNPTPSIVTNTPCEGNTLTFSALPNGMTNYSWNGPTVISGQNPSITSASIGNSGTYTLTVTNVNGCSASVNKLVEVRPNPTAIASSNIPCEGKTLILTGLPNGMQQYIWTGPSTYSTQNVNVNNVNISAVGKYLLTIIDNFGCTDTTSVNVIINSNPSFDFTSDKNQGCPPLSTTFSSTVNNVNSFVWNFGDGQTSTNQNPSHDYTNSGNYDVSLTITNSNGCQNIINKPSFINIFNIPVSNFTPILENKESLSVKFSNSSSQDVVEYSWNFGDNTPVNTEFEPIHTYTEAGKSYSIVLSVTNETGCMDSSLQIIEIAEPLLYYIPNTFSPNGDNVNQQFLPIFTSGFDPFDYKMSIYNRWGELIFESNDSKVGWDGSYGGKLVQAGTYTWSIQFGILADDDRKSIVGSLNLIK